MDKVNAKKVLDRLYDQYRWYCDYWVEEPQVRDAVAFAVVVRELANILELPYIKNQTASEILDEIRNNR